MSPPTAILGLASSVPYVPPHNSAILEGKVDTDMNGKTKLLPKLPANGMFSILPDPRVSSIKRHDSHYFKDLDEDAEYDIVLVGDGFSGLRTAYMMERQDLKIV